MSVLSGFTVEELQNEIGRRQQAVLRDKVQAVYDAIQEAENVALGQGESFVLDLGDCISILYNPITEDWERC